MTTTIIIAVATCALLITSVLVKPKIKIGKFQINTYWLVAVLGAIAILLFNTIPIKTVVSGLTQNSSINPLKILTLFISMTFISVFLDEVGFFKYLATVATKKAKSNQLTLFFVFYALVSVLTIFTSNDIVILTFTPFICYFAKNTKINPIPYLVAEFAAANTWSMFLVIGNPTNIYLATSAGIGFIDYVKVMALPTLLAGIVEIAVTYLLFRKQLKKPLESDLDELPTVDKPSIVIGLLHLGACLILLIISSYVSMEMWLICLCTALSLILISSISFIVRKKKPKELLYTTKRLPWDLIPFVLSMFIIVLALNHNGVTEILRKALGTNNVIIKYGVISYLACNLINNIPMSVLFSTIPIMPSTALQSQAIFSTIVGSNIGAFLTPIGALAGIMFTGLISKQDIKYSFSSFIKYGVIISIPTLLSALLGLMIVL